MLHQWWIVVAGLAACTSARPNVTPAPSFRTEVVMLGTGNPLPDPERSGPSTAVVVDGVAYLFDVGPGVVRRAAAAALRYKLEALAPENLRFVFVTHLHSDHTLGYADVIFTPWVVGRGVPLEVYGPPGIAKMTEHLREAYAEDIAIRTGAEHDSVEGSMVNVHEIVAGPIYKDDHVRITAFAVKHGTWKHAFAYRIEGPDRTIVITGDYALPADAIIAACAGCDVLVSEGYPATLAAGPRGPYLRDFHVSAEQLGTIATAARAKLVVHTHRRNDVSDAALLAEIRRGYAGRIVMAKDLDRL
ncbi:MAG: MBL fold metallo-hydrolase [Kofleriaceae bacterium]